MTYLDFLRGVWWRLAICILVALLIERMFKVSTTTAAVLGGFAGLAGFFWWQATEGRGR